MTTSYILVFLGGYFKTVKSFRTEGAHTFALGLVEGAHVAGEHLTAYVLPDGEAAMRHDEEPAEIERAISALVRYKALKGEP